MFRPPDGARQDISVRCDSVVKVLRIVGRVRFPRIPVDAPAISEGRCRSLRFQPDFAEAATRKAALLIFRIPTNDRQACCLFCLYSVRAAKSPSATPAPGVARVPSQTMQKWPAAPALRHRSPFPPEPVRSIDYLPRCTHRLGAANRIYWFSRSTINTRCVMRFRQTTGFELTRQSASCDERGAVAGFEPAVVHGCSPTESFDRSGVRC